MTQENRFKATAHDLDTDVCYEGAGDTPAAAARCVVYDSDNRISPGTEIDVLDEAGVRVATFLVTLGIKEL